MLPELTKPCGLILTNRERTQLAKAWIALQVTPQQAPEYNSLFWAFRQSYDLAREEPMEAWQLILTIWSLDQSPSTRKSLSTGLIEDLLCYHGEFIIEHIERQAKADRSFAGLLGAVPQNAMPEEVWNRLQDVWIAADSALFLHHVGAKHNEKLPPAEVVESALVEHPAVAEAAVVAKGDPLRGTIVKAYVILAPGREGSDALAAELQEHVKKVTAPYKYPREVEFVSELPKTISGKIRRVELRAR